MIVPTPRIAAAVIVAALVVSAAAADEGWIVERLSSRYEIQPDGSLKILENNDVDFRGFFPPGI